MGGAILDAAVGPAHKRFNINLLEHAISIKFNRVWLLVRRQGAEVQILSRLLRLS